MAHMKVTYIYHSGFSVELDECVLLFDYYKGELPQWEKGKTIYVFASHKHQDHFQLQIFDLAREYPKVHFFLGNDIKLNEKYLERNHILPSVKGQITNIGKKQKVLFDNIEIASLKSTDEGVAFVVWAEGHSIYHAGELNWWHWEGEEELFNQYQEKTYKRQIDKLKGRRIDLAFVVVDQRLSQAVFWGLDYFMEHVDAGLVVPMHLWQDYSLIAACKEREAAAGFRERIFDVKGENQVFEL